MKPQKILLKTKCLYFVISIEIPEKIFLPSTFQKISAVRYFSAAASAAAEFLPADPQPQIGVRLRLKKWSFSKHTIKHCIKFGLKNGPKYPPTDVGFSLLDNILKNFFGTH